MEYYSTNSYSLEMVDVCKFYYNTFDAVDVNQTLDMHAANTHTQGYTYCNRGSVAGVRCHHGMQHTVHTECSYTSSSTGCTDGEVRLVGGSNETEGTVEVCHNKTWGMVSGLGWGEEDARVTCRQLQFSVEGMHCTCIMSLSLYCCRFPFLC